MKLKKRILKYYNNRIVHIQTLLSKESAAFAKEDFHQLRVEIKKIKALFTLVGKGNKKFKQKKYFKPFKKVFKKAGSTRELQLEKDCVETQPASLLAKDYKQYLSAQLDEATAAFFANRKKALKKIISKQHRIVSFIKHTQKKKLSRFIKKQRAKINDLLSLASLPTSALHDLRKKLKAYYYHLKSTHIEPGDDNNKAIHALQDLLGNWHDSRVMADHFKQLPASVDIREASRQKLIKIANQLNVLAKKQHAQIVTAMQSLQLH